MACQGFERRIRAAVTRKCSQSAVHRRFAATAPSAPPADSARAGGFVDSTGRAKKIGFSGMFNAGAKLSIEAGKLVIEKEGKLKKLVNAVEHVTFSGKRAVAHFAVDPALVLRES